MASDETAVPDDGKARQREDVAELLKAVRQLSGDLAIYQDTLANPDLELWMLMPPRDLLLEVVRLAMRIVDREQSATRAVVAEMTAAVLRAA